MGVKEDEGYHYIDIALDVWFDDHCGGSGIRVYGPFWKDVSCSAVSSFVKMAALQGHAEIDVGDWEGEWY